MWILDLISCTTRSYQSFGVTSTVCSHTLRTAYTLLMGRNCGGGDKSRTCDDDGHCCRIPLGSVIAGLFRWRLRGTFQQLGPLLSPSRSSLSSILFLSYKQHGVQGTN